MRRVGRIPIALSLVALGAVLTTDSLSLTGGATMLLLRFWPVLLVAFGLDYLMRAIAAEYRPGGAPATVLRFDAGSLILLLIAVAIGAGATLARSWSQVVGLPFVQVGTTRTAMTTLPAAGVKTLQISTRDGRIELQPGSADGVSVEATYTLRSIGISQAEAARQLEQVQIKATGGEVAAITTESSSLSGYLSTSYVVHAPPGLHVLAGTGSGPIVVTGYSGDLNLTSDFGSIQVQSGAGSLTAITGGGGSILVTSFSGPLTAHTDFGFIRATTGTPPGGDVALSTSGGNIDLGLPPGSSIQVRAQTRGGALHMPSFVAITRDGPASTGAGTSGEGKYRVDLQSVSGFITLLPR